MIILEKNPGEKIPFEVDGTRVTLADDLSINLAQREKDWEVHIDICFGNDNELVIGAAAGRAYVAQIDIPPRQYTESDELVEGETVTTRTPVPLNMDAVTLTLWAV